MSRVQGAALIALLVAACGTSEPPDFPLSLIPGGTSAADSGPPQSSDSVDQDAPDSGSSPTPDSGTLSAPDAGSAEPPDAGPAGRPDSGSNSPDARMSANRDAGPVGTPDSGISGQTDAGTLPKPDAGSATCTTTADCDFNESCASGACVPATTCSPQTNPCPSGTTLQSIPFEQCQPCPSGTMQFAMADDPDAGFTCEGGIGNTCVFTRCLPECTSQADCPTGLYCIAVAANKQECLPLGANDSATLATLQCLSGEANPGVPCLDTAECAYDEVCSGGTCISSPSCGTNTSACPSGTADEAVYLHQCTDCPTGTVQVSQPDDPDGGVLCPNGFFNICVVDRCLIECTSPGDCPTGLQCVTQADQKQVCFPIYPGAVPTRAAAQCVGG